MTPDEIIEMARQAGIEEAYSLEHNQYLVRYKDGALKKFAALVEEKATAKEREACAKVCEENGGNWVNKDCAAAIRARGQA